VEEAIHAARNELGPEAMLITSRRTPVESRHLGAYEVVFGTPAPSDTPPPEPQPEQINAELAVLRDQLEGIKRVLQPGAQRAQAYAQPEAEAVFQTLSAAGLDPRHAREIIDEAARSSRPQGAVSFSQTASGILRQRLSFVPDYASAPEGARRVVVFCGPAGAGKTSSLAKIAVQEFLGRRMSVRVISVDPYRAGAHEKLRALAAIIGLGFTATNTLQEFIEAVDEFQNKDVLLIDTPGYSIAEFDAAREMAAALGQIKSRETHLVLPASMQREELIRYAARYQEFSPNYLLFTKLDETESRGGMLSAALEAARPLSFLGTGQSIPEDIELAAADTLLAPLFPKEKAEATSAA
jgi:flagellar biosynthesis protein FlhF